MKKHILLMGLVVVTILVLSTKKLSAETNEEENKQGTTMIKLEEKDALLESLDTQRKYYLVNKKEKKYAVLYLEVTNKGKYTLEEVTALLFSTTPLEYEAQQKFHKYADKIELYDGISAILEKLLKDGYDEMYFEKNSYMDDVDEYISDITAGIPDLEYSVAEAKVFVHVETKVNTFLRYDMYDTAIKVNLDVVKNNTFVSKELYTLWYPNYDAVKKAMEETLKDVKHKKYSFKEFVNYVESMDENRQLEREPDEIIFEHLVKTEDYGSSDFSGLVAAVPKSKFKKFDDYTIEEGRIYFWIKKNEKDILKSKIQYFVLQNRKKGAYHISSATLDTFNKEYSSEESLMHYSLSDEIEHLLDRVKKSYSEISQEEVIGVLTAKEANEVLSQKIKKSIYLEENVYDIYENMIQHWAIGEESDDYMYHNTFFKSEEQRDKWLQRTLAEKKSYGIKISSKKENKKLLQYYTNLQEINNKYLEQKIIKDKIVAENPILKEKLSAYEFRKFMEYKPLKIVEGNYEVNASWLLDASESSWIIKGDLIVDGTLLYTKDKDNDNFIIVFGNVKVQNYLHDAKFSLMFYAKDVLVENITYLPAASRSWYIHIIGALKTDTLIHSKNEKVKDKKIFLNNEYSITNKNIFVDGFFDGKYADERFMFNQLEAGKDLLISSKLNKEELKNDLLLTSFKSTLKNSYYLNYILAGFKKNGLDGYDRQIIEDVRQGTGTYIVDHGDIDDYKTKKTKDKRLSSILLAQRFEWIAYTFSGPGGFMRDALISEWKDVANINSTYEKEREKFENDPRLALYWLMHFALLDDERYGELKVALKDDKHELIQGAILFLDELEAKKVYAIEYESKQNTEIFDARIKDNKEQLERASISKDDMTLYILSRFEKEPTKAIELLSELYDRKEWGKIADYLKDNPYQVGFSFLHIVTSTEKDKSKWHNLFLDEVVKHEKSWNKSFLLVEMFGVFYEDLDYDNLRTACEISSGESMGKTSKKIFKKMYERYTSMTKPTDMKASFERRLSVITKENFDFQTFINKTQDIESEKRIEFIRLCMKKDLFKETVDEKSMTPYLLLWYIADDDFYPLNKTLKKEHAAEVVGHYKLSEEDFYKVYKEMSKSDVAVTFKAIKHYLK